MSKSKRGRRRERRESKPAAPQEITLAQRVRIFAKRNRGLFISYIVFFGSLLLFTFLYGEFEKTTANTALLNFIAWLTGAVIRVFGTSNTVSGTLIKSTQFNMQIVAACSGLVPMMIYLSAVLAYPAKILHKIIGAVAGFAAIFVLNIVRTVTLFYIGVHFPDIFEQAHLLFWQGLMIVATVVFWLIWVQRLPIKHGATLESSSSMAG